MGYTIYVGCYSCRIFLFNILKFVGNKVCKEYTSIAVVTSNVRFRFDLQSFAVRWGHTSKGRRNPVPLHKRLWMLGIIPVIQKPEEWITMYN